MEVSFVLLKSYLVTPLLRHELRRVSTRQYKLVEITRSAKTFPQRVIYRKLASELATFMILIYQHDPGVSGFPGY